MQVNYDVDVPLFLPIYALRYRPLGLLRCEYFLSSTSSLCIPFIFSSFLPPTILMGTYAYSRVRDLRYIAQEEKRRGSRVAGQNVFDSGWEWGYWLQACILG
jgi:hypothetical protein